MAVEHVVDTLDAISEDVRGAYVESDGKFTLDADKYAEIKAAGLKKKNNELLGKVKQHESELGKFSKFKTLTEALADVEEDDIPGVIDAWQKRAEKKGDDGKAEMERKLQERKEKKQAEELAKIQGDFQRAQSELKDFKLWTPLREVFIKSGGDPQDWEVARLELSHQGRFSFDEEGKIVVMEDGQPSTVSADKFFREVYSEARPKFYKASTASGSGAQNNTSGSGGKAITLSREQAKDPAVYRAAKERAAKAGTQLVIND